MGLLVVMALTAVANPPAASATNASESLDTSSSSHCPIASELERVANPRAAIPAAKAATSGRNTRVIEVKRGSRSTYAASAKRLCGIKVLRKSIYVRLHPVGTRCASCDSRVFMIKYREGPWKLWTYF